MTESDHGSLLHEILVALLLTAVISSATSSTASAQLKPGKLDEPRCANVPVGRDWVFMTFFDQHSAYLNPQAASDLAEMGRLFIRHHISSLKIFGYIDNTETNDVMLGMRRAQTVRAFLGEMSIQPEIITALDGGAIPGSSGAVSEPQNRRVEFRPVLHSSDDELPRKRECEKWLREHAAQCENTTGTTAAAQACKATKSALEHWYLPD